MWKRVWEKLKEPNAGWLVVVYILTAISCGGAIATLAIDYQATWFSVLSYCLYAVAAITLAYTVYTLVRVFPKKYKQIKEKLRRHPLTGKLMQSYSFRTVVFGAVSTALTLAFAVYNAVVAILYRSVWFGALASYYILLLLMRGGIVLYHGRNGVRKKERVKEVEIRKYRNCGIFLTVTIFALSFAVLKMVSEGATFERPGIMIFVVAAYTFYKLTMAIINFVRAKKQDDYTVDALRNVNVADAAVSLLSLQTSMIHQFSEGGMEYMNAITGAGVCLLVFTLGAYMIVRGVIARKKLLENKEEYATKE